MAKKEITKNSLQDWVQKKNKSQDNFKIVDVKQNKEGSLELAIDVRNKETIQTLESSYSNFESETARNLIRPTLKRYSENATVSNYRSTPVRQDLDILAGFDPLSARPQDVYKKAIELYKRKGIYGSVIDILTNFASTGFRNDIDDPKIKAFYDSWVVSVGFDEIVEQIFFEFFRSGFVRTYKTVGRYEPSISTEKPLSGIAKASQDIKNIYKKHQEKAYIELASYKKHDSDLISKLEKLHLEKAKEEVDVYVSNLPKDSAARKIKWSKDFIPINYTILNPTSIQISGNFFFGQQLVELIPDPDLTEYMKRPDSDLTEDEKRYRRALPPDFKKAIEEGKAAPLNPYLVGAIDYRRQPYERYPHPRGMRAWDTLAYKDALFAADLSTIDGINNYILKVTIGSDQHPVTDFSMLEAVADAFDTPAKAFTIFWNHTLDIEKITFPEISEILGSDKYVQANEDLTGALAVCRAIVDGKSEGSPESIHLQVKSLIEEVKYARKCVTRWIYEEYRDIAEGMGFDRFPKVRFDDMALLDEMQMMSNIQGLIDRRILPYRKGIEKLGYDYDDILANMKEEKNLVLDGTLGILGSPYQQAKSSGLSNSGNAPQNVQKTQRTPKGTPSEGRPSKGGMGKPRKKSKADIDIEEVASED